MTRIHTRAEAEYLQASLEWEEIQNAYSPNRLEDVAIYQAAQRRVQLAQQMVDLEKNPPRCDRCGAVKVVVPDRFETHGILCPECDKEYL